MDREFPVVSFYEGNITNFELLCAKEVIVLAIALLPLVNSFGSYNTKLYLILRGP